MIQAPIISIVSIIIKEFGASKEKKILCEKSDDEYLRLDERSKMQASTWL